MSKTRVDSFNVYIDKMLNSSSSTRSKPPMFKVGGRLRSINPEDYDPKIIAIGPFHHGKPHLQDMEQQKVRCLVQLLKRRPELSLDRYLNKIRQLEDKARKCYAEGIQLNEFVEMLILDGCFIIEFLRKYPYTQCTDEDDPVFQYDHTRIQLLHDLMVFENQIPFFIIQSLFDMIKVNNEDIYSLIWPLLGNVIFPLKDLPRVPIVARHLLGVVYDIHCSSFKTILSQMDTGNPHDSVNINSAVELKNAGISFKRSEGSSLFHIEFKNKAMIIPKWVFSDLTESLFRNLIAYEYYLTDSPQKYVTDYVFFMNCLVNSPEDAELLSQNGIIDKFVGSDEMVYGVINQLGKYIMISNKFSYSNIFYTVNRYCGRQRNRWMAILRRKYFNSPWAVISVFAAITLLLLTTIQATFAILSYRNDLKNGN